MCPLRPVRRLPLSRGREGRRACAMHTACAEVRQRHAGDARNCGAACDRRQRPQHYRGRRRPPRRPRGILAATSSSSRAARQLGGAAAEVCQRPAPARPGELASDVVGRHYMAHINSGVIAISQTPIRRSSRRRSASTTTTGEPRTPELARAHPDARQVRQGHILRAVRRGSHRASRSTTWPSTRSTSG